MDLWEADDDDPVCHACGGWRPTPEEALIDKVRLEGHRKGSHNWCSQEECPEATSGTHTVLVVRVFLPPMADEGYAFGYTRGSRLPVIVLLSPWTILDLQDAILRTGRPVAMTSGVDAMGDIAAEMAAKWPRPRPTGRAGRPA